MQSVDELLGQLRGVTGPLPAPPSEPWNWQPWTIAACPFIMVALFLLWRRRPAAQVPPEAEALRQLRNLSAHPTPEALAQCERTARQYLVRRYLPTAMMMTPIELNGHINDAWCEALFTLQALRFAPSQLSPDAWPRLVRQLESLIQGDCGEAPGQ